MNNKIAFLFNKGPYGTSLSKDGLEILLSFSLLINNIGLFFISDGILLLLKNQKSSKINSENFVKTFKVLPLYGIKKIYMCYESVKERGLLLNSKWIIKNIYLISYKKIRKKFDYFNIIMTF